MSSDAIIYCRISKKSDESVMSLDSQEYAIKNWLKGYNIDVFKILKEIGSAFYKFKHKNDISDLRRILSSCKNKILVVYEVNRLSRNIYNFKDIYNICKKNKHSIAIVNLNIIFDYRIKSNYQILFDMILSSQEESAAMGRRISRTIAYKKSRETSWGKMRNEFDEIVDNQKELKISELIKLLSTQGSSVHDIKKLVEELKTVEDIEPFQLVEYAYGKEDVNIEQTVNIGMTPKNIEETFRIYGIRKRRSRWTAKDIRSILNGDSVIDNLFTIDNLVNSMNVSRLLPSNIVNTTEKNKTQWISIWYDPENGLPPNIIVPDGMILPTTAMIIYLPKK
jgi:DNA invertase Pin-like site-specific DNA recombinase